MEIGFDESFDCGREGNGDASGENGLNALGREMNFKKFKIDAVENHFELLIFFLQFGGEVDFFATGLIFVDGSADGGAEEIESGDFFLSEAEIAFV